MLDEFVREYSIFLNPARLLSVCIFLAGFVLTLYVWVARRTGRAGLGFFVVYLSHNRRSVVKELFSEGPGYLVLPLLLIFASMAESYLAPVMGSLFYQ